MQQLILNSVLIATFAIPAFVLRRDPPSGGRGDYQRVLSAVLVFAGIYVPLLLFVYPRLF